MPSNNAPTPTDTLVRVLAQTAESLDYEVKHNPAELRQKMSRAQEVALEVGAPVRSAPEQSGPEGDQSLMIDCYSILITQLGDFLAAPEAQAEVSAQQRRAGIALTWLQPSMRSDLNLFIVGPPGSSDSPDWGDFAGQVERNEQVCRKLVWLPSRDSSQWETGARNFCDRTFLARPWLQQPTIATEPHLDPLGRLAEGNPRMAKWLSLVDQLGDEDGELIDALVAAWGEDRVEAPHVSP
jgi:hypothetical protein